MPELPDVAVYVDRLAAKVVGHKLERLRIGHPFLLRSVTPPVSAIEGRTVTGVERLGKRVVLALDAGGIDVMTASLADFAARLTAENHTVKRSLTDPRLFSGIGNAYCDEILHRARMSPLALTQSLDAAKIERLLAAIRATLAQWTTRLAQEAGDWPAKVTAFHPAMAVHGKFGQPCPECGAPVQRIVRADNETNYCARCQAGGKVLADRGLSRLLKDSWPKHIDELM